MPTKLISQDCNIDIPRSQNVPVGKLCSLAQKILNLSERVLQPKKYFWYVKLKFLVSVKNFL
jgi:hypothetical protein